MSTTIQTVQQSILGRIKKLLAEEIAMPVGIEVANLAHAHTRLEDSKR